MVCTNDKQLGQLSGTSQSKQEDQTQALVQGLKRAEEVLGAGRAGLWYYGWQLRHVWCV